MKATPEEIRLAREKFRQYFSSLVFLRALQDKPLYLGTASLGDVKTRRARNKVARKSRRINRQRRG